VRMLTARAVQEAGRELPLDVGREYDLADVVAEALVCAGAATPVRASDSGGRSTRISSANTTVAAGSFDAIPARDPDHHAAASPSHRRRRAIVPLAIVALVAVAAVVTVASIGRNHSSVTDATTPQPSAGTTPAIPAPSIAEPPPAATPSPPPPPTAVPSTATPQPTAAPPTAAQRSAVSTKTGRPVSGQPGIAPSIARRPTAEPSVATPKSAAQTGTNRSTAGPPPSDAAKPATCRVRVNFTPWAYYTVDHDAARHETPGTIDLAPGEHHLHVWNPELRIERDITLTVPADRDTMNFSEPLQPAALPADPPKP